MNEISTYENSWQFWLDDCCYLISRGVRSLGYAGEVSRKHWVEYMQPCIVDIERIHNVVIRYNGDNDGGTVEVAKHRWIFDLADATSSMGDFAPMIEGLLLGYDVDSINSFITTNKS